MDVPPSDSSSDQTLANDQLVQPDDQAVLMPGDHAFSVQANAWRREQIHGEGCSRPEKWLEVVKGTVGPKTTFQRLCWACLRPLR